MSNFIEANGILQPSFSNVCCNEFRKLCTNEPSFLEIWFEYILFVKLKYVLTSFLGSVNQSE